MHLEAVEVFAVIALVCAAACLAAPPGRIPLALSGIRRMLRKDLGVPEKPATDEKAPAWRRLLAFLLVLAAAFIALV